MSGLWMIALTFIFVAHLMGQDMRDRLEGCPDPSALASALQRLQSSAWKDMSYAKVSRIWPMRLSGLECEPQACTLVAHEARIINGEIECEEAFNFDIDTSPEGVSRERLHAFFIHYTARTRAEIVSVAKQLSRAVGLSEADVAKIGTEPMQLFGGK